MLGQVRGVIAPEKTRQGRAQKAVGAGSSSSRPEVAL